MVHMGGMSLLMLALVGMAFGAMPVNPRNFRSRYGDALVSAAGPAMNFLLAFAALTALAVWMRLGGIAAEGPAYNGQYLLRIFGVTNIALGIFNLIPVPPSMAQPCSAILSRRTGVGSNLKTHVDVFILFIVLLNAPDQYNPFGIAQNVMAAYLGLFGFVMG